MMVEIIGKKVGLKEATKEDIDELYFWKYEEKEQAAKKWNGPYIPALLIIKGDGKTIGYVGSYWVDKNTNWLETGIVIYDKRFWNGGYGSEAYRLWIDFLFTSIDLHRLGMSTWSGNIRMMKVAERIGMKEEARIRNARTVDSEYFDAIKMGILREEWEKINRN